MRVPEQTTFLKFIPVHTLESRLLHNANTSRFQRNFLTFIPNKGTSPLGQILDSKFLPAVVAAKIVVSLRVCRWIDFNVAQLQIAIWIQT